MVGHPRPDGEYPDLTQGLSFGTVNVALPSMMTNLQAELATIQRVITAFMVMRTVVMPMAGWVAAVLGTRTFYLILRHDSRQEICALAVGTVPHVGHHRGSLSRGWFYSAQTPIQDTRSTALKHLQHFHHLHLVCATMST